MTNSRSNLWRERSSSEDLLKYFVVIQTKSEISHKSTLSKSSTEKQQRKSDKLSPKSCFGLRNKFSYIQSILDYLEFSIIRTFSLVSILSWILIKIRNHNFLNYSVKKKSKGELLPLSKSKSRARMCCD